MIAEGVGAITQNDIMLASASDALIVGFNVRPNAEARELASREGVEIRTYDVIYKLTEEIEQALVGKLAAVTTEETIGEAEVRALFRVSRLGTIAGCMVTDGVVRRNASVRVIRDGAVIYTTTIADLKRFKDDVREVAEGFECGIRLDGFNDVKEGDVLEIFETREVERTSLDEAPSAASASARSRAKLEHGARLLAAGFGVRAKRDPVRPFRVAHLGMSGEDRADDLDLAEHRGGEDVEPRAVRRAGAPRCRGGPCGPRRRAPVSQSPPPQSQAAFARVGSAGRARHGRRRGRRERCATNSRTRSLSQCGGSLGRRHA